MLPLRVEIIPSEGIVDAVSQRVPTATAISITCLPKHGVGATLRAAVQLTELGYTVVPHLAAKAVESRAELSAILGDCSASGITEVFAIGGDGQPSGSYSTGGELLRDIAQITSGVMSVGVAGYPEGHPDITRLHLVDALLEKQEHASKIVTQMCFSAEGIHEYVAMLRREGVVLPVWAGVAGAVPKAKLVSLATKIGVGSSLKFLSRKGPLARRLLIGERYTPDTLIQELSARSGIEGIQLYSFNSLDALPTPQPAVEGLR
ncbi:methylenetetrahydrofolate reductase [Paenarthrobacter aromaticivorans]|uniref:methylenetetrahydrofolate reductase n=1 Tax=Paenarthrobacter aromaticivorans TaxID=2849150 RepID=UPI003A7FFCBB